MKMKSLWRFVLPIVVAIGVACITIFFRHDSVPANLSWDELEFARLALSLSHTPYQIYSTLASGHATLYFYILNAFLFVFGTHTWALRLPAALFGIADVALLFVLFQLILKDMRLALVGALLLSTNRWFLTFARFSFEATFLLFLELASLVLLYAYIRRKSTWLLVGSAVAAGLTFHSYIAGRIFSLIPIFRLIFMKKPRAVALFVGICFVIILPLAIYLLQHPDIRVDQVSVFSHSSSQKSTVGMIGESITKTIGMFLWTGDSNGRHNFPYKAALNPIQLLFFFIGFILLLRTWRNRDHNLFVLWAIVAALPTFFTNPAENPNMLRTFTLLPIIMYCMVLTIARISSLVRGTWKKPVLILVAIILLAGQLYDLRTYFQFQSRVTRNAFEITCPLAEGLKSKAKTLGGIPATCRVGKNMF